VDDLLTAIHRDRTTESPGSRAIGAVIPTVHTGEDD